MYSFFANPWMLSALAAVSLPIIIEWLFRRRKRQVELPTIRFLLRSKEQENIKRQDRIILILRMLGIFLLALAISRPLLQHGLLGGARQRNILVILDGTASTNQQVGVTTSFGLAQKKASAMIRDLPEGTTVSVLHLGDRVETVVENQEDLHTASAMIESLRAGCGAASALDVLGRADQLVGKMTGDNSEVYFFSDFQKHTWMRKGSETAAVTTALNKLGARGDLFMVDVGGQLAYNYMLTGLTPREPVMSTGMPVEFLVKVEAWGQQPEEAKATVTFLVDGVKKDVREVRPRDGAAAVKFSHRFTRAGEYVVEAVLSGDEHRVDNRRVYLCTVPENIQVLILDETAMPATNTTGAELVAGGSAKTRPEEDDLSRESAFLARAISPPSHPGMEPVSRFAVKTISPLQLDYENLNEYGAVIVTGIGSLSKTTAAKLENFVADGGALWFFLGERANIYQYNKLLYRDGKGVLPCRLSKLVTSEEADKLLVNFGKSGHQALSQLSDRGTSEGRILAFMELEADAGARVVVAYSNDKPAILERAFGRGRVLVSSSAAGVEASFLPATIEFPVMVQELMRYLVGNPDARVNLEVGDRFEQAVFVSQQHLLVRFPDGHKQRLKPRQRKDRKDAFAIIFDQTNQQGIYSFVDLLPGVLPRSRFAVNQLPEEGDLSRLSRDDFAGGFGSGTWRWIGPEVPVEEFVRKLHSVTEFAPYLLFLLVAALALESLLAARFGRRRDSGVDGSAKKSSASGEARQ
jgi:Aerotolerance regulator N-terminal/von Willebrand factor type A domain